MAYVFMKLVKFNYSRFQNIWATVEYDGIHSKLMFDSIKNAHRNAYFTTHDHFANTP